MHKKRADAVALEQFMVEHNVPNFEVAYNAMRTRQLEEQLTSAKETAIQEYLQSKRRRWKVVGQQGLYLMNLRRTFKWLAKEPYNDYD